VTTFYLDENVSHLLDGLLRGYGHTVIATQDEGRQGSPDAHQLLYATERGWIIITHNGHDFALLHDAWHLWTYTWRLRHRHAGIILAPQTHGYPPARVAQLIHDLASRERSFANGFYYWPPLGGWIRLPL